MKNRLEQQPSEEVKPPDAWEEEKLAEQAQRNPDLKLSKKAKEKLRETFDAYHSGKS